MFVIDPACKCFVWLKILEGWAFAHFFLVKRFCCPEKSIAAV